MTVYILVLTFTANYVEVPQVFKTMESCIVKLNDMKYEMPEVKFECIKSELK